MTFDLYAPIRFMELSKYLSIVCPFSRVPSSLMSSAQNSPQSSAWQTVSSVRNGASPPNPPPMPSLSARIFAHHLCRVKMHESASSKELEWHTSMFSNSARSSNCLQSSPPIAIRPSLLHKKSLLPFLQEGYYLSPPVNRHR